MQTVTRPRPDQGVQRTGESLGLDVHLRPGDRLRTSRVEQCRGAVARKGQGPRDARPRRPDGARDESLHAAHVDPGARRHGQGRALSRAPARHGVGELCRRQDGPVSGQISCPRICSAVTRACTTRCWNCCSRCRLVSDFQAPEIDYLAGESLVAPMAAPEKSAPLILSITYVEPRSALTAR